MSSQSLSIQLGEISNQINAHVFNLRSSGQKHSLYYRQDQDELGNVAQYPRSIIIDQSENIHPLVSPSSYTEIDPRTTWSESVSQYNRASPNYSGSEDAGHHYHRWPDWMQDHTHPRSTQELPSWITTNSNSFSNIFSGWNSENITTEFIECFMEKYHYFLEECDYLSSVNITVDIYNGYSGILTRLLEEIRQESPHVMIPVFAITSPLHSTDPRHHHNNNATSTSISSSHDIHTNTKESIMNTMSIPLCYAHIHELSSMIIPIYPPSVASHFQYINPEIPLTSKSLLQSKSLQLYNVTACIATVIETILSASTYGYQSDYEIIRDFEDDFSDPRKRHDNQGNDKESCRNYPSSSNNKGNHNNNDSSNYYDQSSSEEQSYSHIQYEKYNIYELYQTVTNNHQYPICSLECNIPSLFPSVHHSQSTSMSAQFTTSSLSSFFHEYFPITSTQNTTTTTATTSTLYTRNPFTYNLSNLHTTSTSISSITGGSGSNQSGRNKNSNKLSQKRAYSNLVAFRGSTFQSGLTHKLYEKCIGSSYMISTCHQCPTPLYVANRFPYIYDTKRYTAIPHSHQISSHMQPSTISCVASLGSDYRIGYHIQSMVDILAQYGLHSSRREGTYYQVDNEDNLVDDDVDDEQLYTNASLTGTTSTTTNMTPSNRYLRPKQSINLNRNTSGNTVVLGLLERYGIEKEECEELVEGLYNCANRYFE